METKKRRIYNDDGTMVVESVEVNKKKKNLDIDTSNNDIRNTMEKKTISVLDVFDSFAGYLPPQANFMPSDNGTNCILCGKQTSSSMRKICFDCMKTKGKELYKKSKKAIENGNKEFDI